MRVSIPVWCDLEKVSKIVCEIIIIVSIPVWCDLECFYCNKIVSLFNSFNSSMVRFGAFDAADKLINNYRFNSSMVRFGVQRRGWHQL